MRISGNNAVLGMFSGRSGDSDGKGMSKAYTDAKRCTHNPVLYHVHMQKGKYIEIILIQV